MPCCNPFGWLFLALALAALFAVATVAGALAYWATLPLSRSLNIRPGWIGLPVAVVVGTGAIAAVVCGFALWSRPVPQPVPDRSRIVGQWVATPDSVRRMVKEGPYEPRTPSWTFRDDGTFTMEDMPNGWLDVSLLPSPGFSSTTGTWKLINTQFNGVDDWSIAIWLQSMPRYEKGVATDLELSTYGREYVIYTYLGGADSGVVLNFKRVE